MALSIKEMQRQLHRYALSEMRNRGLEEAAKLLDRAAIHQIGGYRRELNDFSRQIRNLKENPSRHLTDWWGREDECAIPVFLDHQ